MLGLLLLAIALNVAGVIVIAEGQLSASGQLIALLVFVLLASLTVMAPLVYCAVTPTGSKRVLAATRQWLIAHNKAITAAVLLLLGLNLISAGAQRLVAS